MSDTKLSGREDMSNFLSKGPRKLDLTELPTGLPKLSTLDGKNNLAII
jgi:hypothetical protein